MQENILVSICCVTYNHEAYIRECLNGFVTQQTNFKFEVLIHDDASTDKTADIIREYESQYPDIIKPIYQIENQYSKGIGINMTYQFSRAKGKYVTLCEGDDYWIDPLKLQKQVDFMQNNSDCSICSSGYYTKKNGKIIGQNLLKNSAGGFWFTLKDLNRYWYCKTLTVLFRKEILDRSLPEIKEYESISDFTYFYHILKYGKGYYFSEIFGVYSLHDGGVWGLLPKKRQTILRYKQIKEMYLKTKDPIINIVFFSSIIAQLRYKGYTTKKEFRTLITELLMRIHLFFPWFQNSLICRRLIKRSH